VNSVIGPGTRWAGVIFAQLSDRNSYSFVQAFGIDINAMQNTV